MHIHPPKPLHGWKEFLNEIFVIVVGVLIALGLEQVVEELHWQHKVQEGRERLDDEIKANYGSAVAQVALAPCFNAQFDALERRILASGATLDPAPGYPPPDRLAFSGAPQTPMLLDYRITLSAVWETLNTDGTVLHMPIVEQRRLGVIYYFAKLYTEDVNKSDLLSELTMPIPLSAEVRYQLLARVEALRKNHIRVENAAVQLAAFSRQMNHFMPDDEADAYIHSLLAKPIALCMKAGYPLADWKAAIARIKPMSKLGA